MLSWTIYRHHEDKNLNRSKTLIDNNQHVSFEHVEAMVKSQIQPDTITDVIIAEIDLGVYDRLLEGAL
jgi:hypothetical protein